MVFGRTVDTIVQERIAGELYIHQNFKSSYIGENLIHKFPEYSSTTLTNFHSILRRYLKTGFKDLKRATPAFFATIDALKKKNVDIKIPTEQQRARAFSNHIRRNSKVPVKTFIDNKIQNITNNPSNEKISISKSTLEKLKANQFIYALKLEDKIQIFDSFDERKGYIKAYTQIDPSLSFQKIKLSVQYEDEN